MNTTGTASLPESVSHLTVDGKDIYLIGTAHVSRESVRDVSTTIEAITPDTVCVELCEPRYLALVNQSDWRRMNIFKVVREKKALLLLAQLVLNSFYKQIGRKLGVEPGAEMVEAVRCAERADAGLVLADRPVEITLKRVWGFLSFWNKLKMMLHLSMSFFVAEDIDENLIEQMKNRDQLENILQNFTRAMPELKHRLIDERDRYLAHKIRSAPGGTVVAVVGAGHVSGIASCIGEHIDVEPLMELPPKSCIPQIVKWALPAVIAALIVAGFFKGGMQSGIESVYIWVVVNGTLAAAGSALALAHPLTIITSFLGAPITSLNPMIAAGWVAGIVQAWVRKPTVSDLEELPSDIMTVRGFWKNPVCKILLVVVMANLGSSLGTFISGGWIAARIFN